MNNTSFYIMLGGDVRNQKLADFVKRGQIAYIIESCPYLASGMVNKAPTATCYLHHLLINEIFETSSKYIYLPTNRRKILC